MPDYNQSLKQSWHQFCEDLQLAGDVVFRDTAPDTPLDRAKGIRFLSRNIALALQFKLENNDAEFPELMRYFDPVRKQGGDNSDALYVGAPINGHDTYRVAGRLGSASYFAVTVLEDGDTPWGGAVVGVLFGDQIETDADGNFELWLSPRQHSGNCIVTTTNSFRVTFRQFFSDWENEQAMEASIERVGALAPPAQLTPAQVGQGLLDAAAWLRESTTYWADKLDLWQARPNQFIAFGEMESQKIDATPGGTPLIAYWKLPRDEALVIRVTPPACAYWNVEFGNYWWETMDYRYRHCSLTEHYTQLQPDGELIVVVTHEDLLVANWLDPCGHKEGYITFRWIGAEHSPRPVCQQVKIEQLFEVLPASIARVTAEQRIETLAARKRGVARRFRA